MSDHNPTPGTSGRRGLPDALVPRPGRHWARQPMFLVATGLFGGCLVALGCAVTLS